MMADAYRKSAMLLNVDVSKAELASTDPKAATTQVAAAAKRERLTKARDQYEKVIEFYREHAPGRDLDKLHLKLAHFYRADNLFDLGRFEEAIKLYDAAALKYQNDPASLAAYVQIVNSYCSLGKFDQAKTANQRAKWLLRRMPPESFQDGSFAMPKAYWEQWLKWTNEAGLWAKEPNAE